MPIITILKYYPLFIIIIESRSLTRHVCLSINAEISFLSQYRTHNCHNANGIEWEHEIIKCNKSEWKRENEKEERGAEPSVSIEIIIIYFIVVLRWCWLLVSASNFQCFLEARTNFWAAKSIQNKANANERPRSLGAMHCTEETKLIQMRYFFRSQKGENFYNRNSHNVS